MGEIVVVGVGYEPNQLTLEAVSLLKSGARILLHTSRCGCAEWLRGEGIAFESLDALYESCEDFDDHARAAAEAVRRAAEAGDVVYGVFDVRDASVGALLGGGERDVRVVAGVPAEGALLRARAGRRTAAGGVGLGELSFELRPSARSCASWTAASWPPRSSSS